VPIENVVVVACSRTGGLHLRTLGKVYLQHAAAAVHTYANLNEDSNLGSYGVGLVNTGTGNTYSVIRRHVSCTLAQGALAEKTGVNPFNK
jgi:hypothetical protein